MTDEEKAALAAAEAEKKKTAEATAAAIAKAAEKSPSEEISELKALMKDLAAKSSSNIAGISESTGAAILEGQKLLHARLDELGKSRRRKIGFF